jgi:hypothetical protein
MRDLQSFPPPAMLEPQRLVGRHGGFTSHNNICRANNLGRNLSVEGLVATHPVAIAANPRGRALTELEVSGGGFGREVSSRWRRL